MQTRSICAAICAPTPPPTPSPSRPKLSALIALYLSYLTLLLNILWWFKIEYNFIVPYRYCTSSLSNWYHIHPYRSSILLSLILASCTALTSTTTQHIYSLTPYFYLSYDHIYFTALYVHHSYSILS